MGAESWTTIRARIAGKKRQDANADVSAERRQLDEEMLRVRKARLVNQAKEILEKFSENGSPE